MSDGVTLAQLRALAAVVEQGSFSRAADALGLSQPAVSGTVAALERRVGGAVVDRRSAAPTALGAALLPHARDVVRSVAAVEAQARRHADASAGVVRLAVVTTVRSGVLPGLLAGWSATLPGVRIEVLEGDDDELPGWLAAGMADAAVLVDPDGPDAPGAVELPGDLMCAVLRRDHPLADQPGVTVTDLADDDLLCGTGGCERQLRVMYAAAGEPFSPAHRVAGLPTMLAMVLHGDAITIAPAHGAALVPDGLVMVPVRPDHRRRLVLTGPVDRPWSPLVAALVDAAR